MKIKIDSNGVKVSKCPGAYHIDACGECRDCKEYEKMLDQCESSKMKNRHPDKDMWD